MYKFLVFIVFISVSTLLSADDKQKPQADQKPEYTQEQLDKLKAAEEQFKDNPEMMRFINKIKEQSGLTEQPETPPAVAAPQEPPVQGSRSVAEKAYESGDYETAFKHYQALAAEGDEDASLVLGTMYEQGLGTDKDPASAHAWYKKAADAGDKRGKEMMSLIDDKELSDADRMKAQEKYEEISRQDKDEQNLEQSGQNYRLLLNTGNLESNSVRYVYAEPERAVKVEPEKYHPEHRQLQTGNDHFQPEKFRRETTSVIKTVN